MPSPTSNKISVTQKIKNQICKIDSLIIHEKRFPRYGTCKIIAKVQQETLVSPKQDILLDSGAFRSCMSAEFVRSCNFQVQKCHENFDAVDASKKAMKFAGEITANIIIEIDEDQLIIENICFGILPVLSVDIIVGCDVLSMLNFGLDADSVYLGKFKIPRVLHTVLPSSENMTMDLKLQHKLLLYF